MMMRKTQRTLSFVIALTLIYVLSAIVSKYQPKIPDPPKPSTLDQNSSSFEADKQPEGIALKGKETITSRQAPKVLSQVKSSWKFIYGSKGERDAVLELRGACLDHKNRLFLPSQSGPSRLPKINVAGSADTMDILYQVQNNDIIMSKEEDMANIPVSQYHRDKDLFVLGTVWAYHLSHFFVNNVMPLYNLIWNINGMEGNYKKWRSRDLLVVGGSSLFDVKSLKFDKIYYEGKGKRDKVQDFGLVCYDRVIVGLNSTCDCCGCVKDFNSVAIHNITRNIVLESHLTPTELEIAQKRATTPYKERPFHLVIVDRLANRRILNLVQVQEYLENRKTSFEIVNLEHKSFTDQVRLFALNATMLMATHGNSIGNSFWMAPGSVVLELHAYGQGSAWFEHLLSDVNSIAGPTRKNLFEYKVLKCKDQSCKDPKSNGFNSNVIVDLAKLDFVLDQYEKH